MEEEDVGIGEDGPGLLTRSSSMNPPKESVSNTEQKEQGVTRTVLKPFYITEFIIAGNLRFKVDILGAST